MSDGDRRLDPRVGQDFQRLRIEVGGEIRGVRAGVGEQLIVDADFRRHRLRGRQPVHGGLDLASVGRVAALGRGIVGAAQFDHFARVILDDAGAFDEIGVAQPHLVARRQAEELLRRVLHEIVALDIELAAERNLSRARRQDRRDG